jgi:hypothetical protein
MARMLLSGFVFALALAVPSLAQAQEIEAPPKRVVEGSAGLKILLGGNLWTTPSETQGGDGLGFRGDGGGFGWGVAAYGEARFIQHLGVELDLGYDNSKLQRKVTVSGVDNYERVSQSGPRISLLFKGIGNAPFGRMWVGIGPEFYLPSSTTAETEAGSGIIIPTEIRSTKKNSTMLAMALGLVIHAGEKIEIPVELRAAKNLSQDSKWTDRVDISNLPASYDVTVQNSWDFRLGFGAGYRF